MSSSMPRWFVVALCNDIKMYSSNDLHYLVEFFFFFFVRRVNIKGAMGRKEESYVIKEKGKLKHAKISLWTPHALPSMGI